MREILSVALELACDGGLDNLTLHKLADRMNRSVAAVYRYFPSREAVISELQRLIATHIGLITHDAQKRVDKWAEANNISAQETVLTKILIAGFVYDAFGRAMPNELGLVTRYLSTPDHVLPQRDAAHVFEVTASLLDTSANLVATAQQQGSLTPGEPRDRAIMLWAGLQGTVNVLKVVRRGGWTPHTDLTQQMVITTLAGWGADPKTLAKLAQTIVKMNFTRIERTTQDLLGDTDAQNRHQMSRTDERAALERAELGKKT